ncbi:MAG TPA: DUF4157 domain-containing protein, partial [Kofleriaceae bacterium]|nr:DUF4157 domain-containing protein [Kofleriaceae bacterium]
MSREDKSRLNNMLAGRPGPAGAAATPGKGSNTENLEAGKPLDPSTRSVFESSLSTDLSDVRVHDGEAANAQAGDQDALAYAQGNDIFFAAGQYDPNNDEKRGLLAHEVAHVAQQKGAPADRNPNSTRAGDAAERDADQAAARMVHGAPATVSSTPQQIAKKGPNDKKPTKIPLAQGVTAKFTKIQAGGKPTAAPDGKGGTITFTSPEVEFRGQFSVKSDKV